LTNEVVRGSLIAEREVFEESIEKVIEYGISKTSKASEYR
jgi:hypothetical protein